MEPTLYVVVRYATDRVYGGPEEGGWWYTYGELEKVVLATRDEDRAFDWCRRLNDARADLRRTEFVSYDVVELPRQELKHYAREHACHADWDLDENDYETRWDIPMYFPEVRPHYC